MSLKGNLDEISVPGSVANLGAGFDTLAVAVQLYLRVRIVDVRDDGAGRLTVVSSAPPVRGRSALERAYESVVAATGRRAPSVFVESASDIPMAAGLGSSAAAAVAGLRVFERVAGPVPEEILLAIATSLEGHADNAAASLHGGMTSVVEREGREPVALRWSWPDEVRIVVATPATGLATAKARAALSATITRTDAVFNLQRALAFVHALQTGDYEQLREASRDRWHQSAREPLVPKLADVLALDDPGILAAFLSGAGPSVAVLARREFARIEQLLASTYERDGLAVTVRTLAAHKSADVPMAVAHGRPV